jgi:nucleoside 2-deoxyribosyltransferase
VKFYLASGLENVASAHFFRDALVSAGHTQTYDWTTHGAVAAHGIERIRQVAAAELKGVLDADFVVVVLPGARGTHFEMGAAYQAGKPIFVYAPKMNLISAHPDTCAFYHLPNVLAFSGDETICTLAIIRLLDPKTHLGDIRPRRAFEDRAAYQKRFLLEYARGFRRHCPACTRTVLPEDLDDGECPGCDAF